jgi:hypothetical protein
MTRSTEGADAPQDHRDSLDEQIAVRVGGFRWVEWNHALLAGAPLDAPGRFLARPDHFLGHLHIPAAQDAPLADRPLAHVPHFATCLDHAAHAAELAGLFRAGGSTLWQGDDGKWWIKVENGSIRLSDERLPALICRASLAFVDRQSSVAGVRGSAPSSL